MDIKQITSYLLGNDPKYDKVSRLEFLVCEKIYGYNLKNLTFFGNRQINLKKSFILLFLKNFTVNQKRGFRKAKLDKLLKELSLLELITSNGFDYNKLLKEFEAIIKTTTKVKSGRFTN
ncbi:MAG: hypothetical protein Q9M97_06720 [Candidatus Gracilibacteria bacterium]|nr:hypothetical protein [Candidatus Gracilibacteria bacterium]